MLNYWRTAASTGGGGTARATANIPAGHDFSDYGVDGPFFDLEFALSDHESSETATASSESDDEMTEIELNLDVHDRNFNISPFYKIPDENSKPSVSLLKSAAKFRVLLLKLKKLDSSNGEKVDKSERIEDFRVRFKVDEVKGSLISLFARDYSTTNSAQLGREMMQKYLNILKPLYVGVEKMKSSGQVRFHGGGGSKCGGAVSPPPETGLRSSNLQAGFKVVRKHLVKSRSTSTAVSPPAKVGSNRHDESVQDGIQGAILHCKRSFNLNKEGEVLSGSVTVNVSDPYCEKPVISSAT